MKRKCDLIKQDIMSLEDWKLCESSDERPSIGNTKYVYEAYPAKLKIINKNTKQVTTFNGRFCGKRVMFRLENGRINIEGIIKPPKDPFKKLFWEKGFTGARRCKSMGEFIESVIGLKENINHILTFIRENDDIKKETFYWDNLVGDNNSIVLYLNTKTKQWWASEDLTLDEAKLVLDEFNNCKV